MQQRARLLGHGERQLGRERGISAALLHRIDDAIEPQPLFEELIERLAALRRILEHAPRGALASRGRAELTLRSRLEQRVVRHRVPEQVRQAARRVVVGGPSVGPGFDVEEEVRRLQHRLDDDARAVEEAAAHARLLREHGRVALHFVFGQRPAERAQAEPPHERVAALLQSLEPIDAACRARAR